MNRQEFITRWPNFKPEEFMCHCGKCGPGTGLLMKATNLDKLQALRTDCGFSFPISSGYRCPKHPVEKKKRSRVRMVMGRVKILPSRVKML
jgi:hypothetical protein